MSEMNEVLAAAETLELANKFQGENTLSSLCEVYDMDAEFLYRLGGSLGMNKGNAFTIGVLMGIVIQRRRDV